MLLSRRGGYFLGLDNILTGGVITADGWTAPYVPGNAADNNESTFWYNNASSTHWWKYDLVSTAKSAHTLRLLSGGVSPNYALKVWSLYASNDDSNWTLITSGTQENNFNWQAYTFTSTAVYRYWKIIITSGYVANPYVAGIAEVQLIG
jgi:hypothetical protein